MQRNFEALNFVVSSTACSIDSCIVWLQQWLLSFLAWNLCSAIYFSVAVWWFRKIPSVNSTALFTQLSVRRGLRICSKLFLALALFRRVSCLSQKRSCSISRFDLRRCQRVVSTQILDETFMTNFCLATYSRCLLLDIMVRIHSNPLRARYGMHVSLRFGERWFSVVWVASLVLYMLMISRRHMPKHIWSQLIQQLIWATLFPHSSLIIVLVNS